MTTQEVKQRYQIDMHDLRQILNAKNEKTEWCFATNETKN